MRLSQPASASTSEGGKHNRLAVKRKKHKRLDSICESVLDQNRRAAIKDGEETNRVESLGDESELRRSSRMRRAPVLLDVSPPPSKKRRKKFDVNGRRTLQGSCGRGTEQVENERGGSGSDGWRSRLRSRAGSSDTQAKGNTGSPRGKRKLYKDLDKIEGELELLAGDGLGRMEGTLNGRKSTIVKSKRPGRVRASLESDAELHAESDDGSQKVSVDEISVRGNGTLMMSQVNDANMNGYAAQVTEEELEVGSFTHSGEELIVDDVLNNDVKVDANVSQLLEKDSEVSGQLPLEENLIANVDAHEEQWDSGASKVVEKENEVLNDKHLEGNPTEASEQRYNTSGTTERKEYESDGKDIAEQPSLPIEPKKVGGRIDGNISSLNLHREGPLEDKHAKQAGKSIHVPAAGLGKLHVKEGRRCGLCGGGTDGKPPKRLIPGAGGSDHEAYSGSSESEEPEYDFWDGFGEEPTWLGRLLGPISDRYGIAGIWVHQQCAVWSPEVYFAGLGCLKNIRAALCRGKALKCTRCGRPGATTGCRVDRCPKTYHLPCARASRCIFDHRKFLIACTDHGHLFQPHGNHYVQRIKKLKAKKMKLELRKTSHEAWRKDHDAEEKWLEKCGEDEEFLKRESKRLQRDMLRIAPVYIGGPHSGGGNVFEGWDSVAGLQDVIRCMKEVVILPLLYPEFFDNMGLTPPRGVLLHGYPGTGKTLVVRALIGSIARGDRRIAYFARKGADCLGKYVGDAERQLRLLFQAAEKSQPSIIFFDEIDGLAPVRTRQQDQTHSSVVSTLLALMDGLKSRGSVVVIGATNRPDAVDPALRRPGRFDREIYFPLPKVEDRAGILALHTRKWQKPLDGSLLEWIARQTAGFAGADLQALCTQAAMTALRRSCPLHKILSVAGKRGFEGKCPQLPSFIVEERDWLEALSSGPPPCSRREAGIAANEIAGSPLHSYLVPHLLQPLSSILVSLYLDERIWLPPLLVQAGAAIKTVIVSALREKNLCADKWWFHVLTMTNESETAYKIVTNLSNIGILTGEVAFAWNHMSNDVLDDVNARLGPCSRDSTLSSLENLCNVKRKEVGYRLLIAGKPRSGQKHIVSCLLQCFVGNMEMQKIDMATIAQEGHGDVLQGITQILMKCASVKSCLLFLPRIDLWAIDVCSEVLPEEGSSSAEDPTSDDEHVDSERGLSVLDTSESGRMVDAEVVQCASQTWNCFAQQVEVLCGSSSLTILATSELPYQELPPRVRQFFESGPSTPEGWVSSQHAVPRITVHLDGRVNLDSMIHSSASVVIRDLLQHFIQLVYHKAHLHEDPQILFQGENKHQKDITETVDSGAVEETENGHGRSKDDFQKMAVPSNSRMIRGKSSLSVAITCFGYQVLSYPHFAELCWVTSKLKGGPSADINGPWKGWPFNSCIVRASNPSENAAACVSGIVKDKKQFSLARGLIAVGLSAYRGVYTSLSEVSFEVRKVLELLVKEVSTRIHAGKDRYQFVRLLSQVAYLEDMVNSWVHSLKSLELDAQSEVVKPKLTGPSLADNNQACVHGPPINLSENVCEVELIQSSLDCTTISNAEPAALNSGGRMNSGGRSVASDDVQQAYVLDGNVSEAEPIKGTTNCTVIGDAEAATSNEEGRNAANGDESELPKAGDSTMKNGAISEPLISQHQEELLKQFDVFANMKSHVTGDFGAAGSSHNLNESVASQLVEKRALAGEAEPDINIDTEISLGRSTHPSEGPRITCSYSCCSGCMKSLHQLIEKVVSKELELTSGCETVDDVHDFVASLSSSLCSAVRRQYAAGNCRNVIQFEELDGCNCRMPESEELVARECTCHPGKSNNIGVNSSLGSIFTFKDGILVPSDPEKVTPFHCIYENLCLCSLIELTVMSRRR